MVRTNVRCALMCVLVAAGCGGGARSANVRPSAMPRGAHFTGVYFSPQYGRLDLALTDRGALYGAYTKNERVGELQGTANGDLARFTWKEKRELIPGKPHVATGHGYFKYVVDPDTGEHKLVGEWGYDKSEVGGGPWRAVKSTTLKPSLPQFGITPGPSKPVTTDSNDPNIDSIPDQKFEENELEGL